MSSGLGDVQVAGRSLTAGSYGDIVAGVLFRTYGTVRSNITLFPVVKGF